MPVFHDQQRDSLRRLYLEAWERRTTGLPVTALQAQVADVVALHPEYHDLLSPESLDRDWSPEQGQSNPFLHMGMHLALREQVSTDRPPGIREVHATLVRRLGSAHEAEHLMMEPLGAALWNAQRQGRAPDEQQYLADLRRL
jgi:Domain of unknown function (DUF1841)